MGSPRLRGQDPWGPEAGYNMVVLMVAVTVLTVFVAASLPMWTQRMTREKEAELIFRGWQYAEAIRVFQQRHGRYPTRLEELIEIKPRSIRKLWKDPMSDDGEWGLVFQGQVGAAGGVGREPGEGGKGEEGPGLRGQAGTPHGPAPSRTERQRTVGPIIGVRSRSDEKSIKTLFGEQRYDRWGFTVEQLGAARLSGIGLEGLERRGPVPLQPADGGSGHPRLPRAEWIGKPLPEGLQPAKSPAGVPRSGNGRDTGAQRRR